MTSLLKIPRFWLFVLIAGIPLAGFPFTLFGMLLDSPMLVSLIYFVILLVPSALYVLWLYAVGTRLYLELEPAERRILNHALYRNNLFFLLGYLVVLFIFIFLTFDSGALYHVLFLPLHLYAAFSLLYGINFAARTLSMADGEGSELEDYFGNLFLFWFFPIGLWVVQPKMNGFFKDET